MLGSLRQPIEKGGSTASVSPEDALCSINLSAKILTLFIYDIDSK